MVYSTRTPIWHWSWSPFFFLTCVCTHSTVISIRRAPFTVGGAERKLIACTDRDACSSIRFSFRRSIAWFALFTDCASNCNPSESIGPALVIRPFITLVAAGQCWCLREINLAVSRFSRAWHERFRWIPSFESENKLTCATTDGSILFTDRKPCLAWFSISLRVTVNNLR